MTKQEQNELCKKVSEVWAEDEVDVYDTPNVKVTIDGPDIYEVTASRMYEYLPLTFKHLKKLSEIFGTENFNVNHWASEGCETCDYGSCYRHEFTVKKSV